jgi:subtilase family serine protease
VSRVRRQHLPGMLIAGLVLLACVPPSVHATTPRAPALQVVAGTLPPLIAAHAAARLGSAPQNRPLHLAILLASRHQAQMNQVLQAIYDPRSPQYHHFLTPAAFAARFGPDPRAVQTLIAWFHAQGMRTGAWHGQQVLFVSTNVHTAATAFHTSFGEYLLHGQRRLAVDRPPVLPEALAAAVRTIVGLSEQAAQRAPQPLSLRPAIEPAHPAAVAAAHLSDQTPMGPGGGYTPADLAAAYDFQPIYASGLRGEGMRVALVELAAYLPSDIAAYAAQFGLATPQITDINVDGGNASEPAQVEATLDIEELLAAAPAAAIDVYNAPNDTTGTGQIDAYTRVAASGTDSVLSLEWVNCEPAAVSVPGFVAAQHVLFKQMALQGISVVSATGDAGAYACGDQVPSLANQPSVNLPASDPYVLAVGASDATLSTTGGHTALASEAAWSCPVSENPVCSERGPNGAGSGGGTSVIFKTGDQFGTNLSWQVGPGLSSPSGTVARQVPDVVMSGSFGTPEDHEDSIYYLGSWKRGAGTSAATPWWAGLLALTDEHLRSLGLPAIGWANPLVYQLADKTQPYPPYHDITSGNNLLYNAGPGWDFATGWGSPDAWNFLRDATAAIQAGQASATATPMTTSTPTATRVLPSPTLTRTPVPAHTTPVATVPFPTTTPVRATPTPARTPKPADPCATKGIANGIFQTGTLACWGVVGKPAPHIVPSTHFAHRFAVRLGNGAPGSGAIGIKQTVQVSPTVRLRLHLDYWLARSIVRQKASPAAHTTCTSLTHCPAALAPRPPQIVLLDAAGKLVQRVQFLPHRDRAWSGLVTPLPLHQARLTVEIVVPAQPRTASVLLEIDHVQIAP